MFIGHYGVALAGKRLAPRTSLGTLFVAAQFLDILWPVMILFGWEHVRIIAGFTAVSPLDLYDYPLSHSLLLAALWSALFGGVYFAITRYRAGAWTVSALVLSHWFLDLIVHRPDLLLMPGAHRYFGFGLWNSRLATALVELPIYLAGVAIYARTTRSRDRIGRYGFWAMAVFFLLMGIGNLKGTPPPSVSAMVWTMMVGGVLFVAWAIWVDRHRSTAVPASTSESKDFSTQFHG
jgi:hypothetical protein